jgi:glycosyltransferase involved in cell wall biosynthesis
MTGSPIVHIGSAQGSISPPGTFEIRELIDHGKTGFIVDTVEQAQEIFARLLNDSQFAAGISIAGRAAAIELFGRATISKQWEHFFSDALR